MLHNSKPSSWLVALIILVAAVGIGLFTYSMQGVPKEKTNGTQKDFLPEDAGSNPDILISTMIEQLKIFPQKYDTEVADKSGIVSINQGNMHEGTSNNFDSFVANSAQGKAAQVIIVVYTAEGDPIFENVLFDGMQYFAVIDSSRDRLNSDGVDYLTIRYDYLKIITHIETGSKFVILSNNSELTFELLRNAQIASDMESIDSYQLFSYSE